MLKDSSSLDNPEYYCNNGNYKEDVNKTSHAVSDKSYCPWQLSGLQRLCTADFP